uniref:Putative secreted protein fat body overexpressed n=1 Tax=Rhipicephalus microplus TaxID=6941 RepID=A0A6M2D943_RHIMP
MFCFFFFFFADSSAVAGASLRLLLFVQMTALGIVSWKPGRTVGLVVVDTVSGDCLKDIRFHPEHTICSSNERMNRYTFMHLKSKVRSDEEPLMIAHEKSLHLRNCCLLHYINFVEAAHTSTSESLSATKFYVVF